MGWRWGGRSTVQFASAAGSIDDEILRLMTMGNAKPAASVLLPVYNASRFLAAAIDSVLAQTFSNFELLLLNDGSTDGSAAILESYAARDKRCKVHAWPNRGLIATLN